MLAVPLMACLLQQMNDSKKPKWISLLKDNNYEANQFPRLQISEHLLFEAVLVHHLEVK